LIYDIENLEWWLSLGWGGDEDGMGMGKREFSGMMVMFYTKMEVWVTEEYVFVKIQQMHT
jgi:hypothetical protein